jgi:hypothetical protein
VNLSERQLAADENHHRKQQNRHKIAAWAETCGLSQIAFVVPVVSLWLMVAVNLQRNSLNHDGTTGTTFRTRDWHFQLKARGSNGQSPLRRKVERLHG